jgi:hypothetical protein
MASGKFVEKQVLIDQIQQIAEAQESAFFSILTDMKSSVLLRFSTGKLVHIYCRSVDVKQTPDAINAANAINRCRQLKFVCTNNGQPKNKQEVMPVADFLASIGAGVSEPSAAESANDHPVSTASTEPDSVVMPLDLQNKLADIARDYIGLVADMLIADICSKEQPLAVAIEQIAGAMPARRQSDAFRERALAAAGIAAENAGAEF